VRYLAGNYGDEKLLREVLRDVDEVIHLAYSTVPKTSFENPIQDILTNLPASVTLFDAASRFSIRKLVFVSSGGTVYGKASSLPITENHPKNPISPYGITKLTIENYATMFHKLKGLPFVCVRPANAYGERQRPFIDQGFVATAIASILNGKQVVVFGDRGTTRDYVHVTDIASGILAALDLGQTSAFYNLGTGIGKNNMEVLDAIRPYAESEGYEVRVTKESGRVFDVPVNVLDSSKLRTESQWEPIVTFEDGIRRTWNWFSHNSLESGTRR
jgi:UDP-glucose 4-epimerase